MLTVDKSIESHTMSIKNKVEYAFYFIIALHNLIAVPKWKRAQMISCLAVK